MKTNFDDPRLTAHAVNEPLSAADRAAIEALLAESPEVQMFAEEMRGLGADLRAQYNEERVRQAADGRVPNVIAFVPEPRSKVEPWLKSLARIAAAVIAVCAVFGAGYMGWKATQPAELGDGVVIAMKATMEAPVAFFEEAQDAPLTRATGTGTYTLTQEAAYFSESDAPLGYNAQQSEAYTRLTDNSFLAVAQNPLSTFSADVDTASYANARRFLAAGKLPPKDAVRIEEFVNYFPFRYAPPLPDANTPFAVQLESAAAPWNTAHRLVRVGVKAREIRAELRGASNLVFLIDVSGSMFQENRLPLVKKSLRLLTEQLDARDRVAIVVYAGKAGLVLPPTTGDRKDAILGALDRLEAGGSTNGGDGIKLAYRIATENFINEGINRVILCTDGDFNVGVTSEGELTRLVEEQAKSKVFLSVLGFGMGNYKDTTCQKLADRGNGNSAYIDTLREARKVLVEQMAGTLVTVAKDVKFQVEFNPARVSSYRLIGYEKRLLKKEDFNDDKVDAGEIGAGHTVTALYECVPVGVAEPGTAAVDPLKYQAPAAAPLNSAEMLTVKIRWKAPEGEVSERADFPLADDGRAFSAATPDFKFATAVAAFAMTLRESPERGNATIAAIIEWALEGRGDDPGGYRAEFIELARKAQPLLEARAGKS